jgi:nitroreductase
MDVYEAIAARRTIRDFDDRPIDRSILLRILDAGLKAPTNNHLRQWHFVLVDGRAQREALARFFTERTEAEVRELIDGWGMEAGSQYDMYLDAIPKQASMVIGAAELLVPCFRQRGALLGPKESLHELNAFASIWAVIENILIAAASEGIFGVTKIISTPEERDHVRATLEIPDEFEIPCYLPLGYPATDAVRHPQVSIAAADRLSIDRWGGESPGA